MSEHIVRALERLEEKTDEVLAAVHENKVESLREIGDIKSRVASLETQSLVMKWIVGVAIGIAGLFGSFTTFLKGA